MISKRFVRFILIGILNTAFAYSLYALLIFLGLRFDFAILISTILQNDWNLCFW
jgi:putative flippase GtrA